ncbi:MAG: hypothetical protein IPJ90_08965 [Anaerolineaceae bacterium]|nr:hypothetical protein [Anaerolineaceae bacterium]
MISKEQKKRGWRNERRENIKEKHLPAGRLESRLLTITDESEKSLVSEKLNEVRQKMLELDNEEKNDYRTKARD